MCFCCQERAHASNERMNRRLLWVMNGGPRVEGMRNPISRSTCVSWWALDTHLEVLLPLFMLLTDWSTDVLACFQIRGFWEVAGDY